MKKKLLEVVGDKIRFKHIPLKDENIQALWAQERKHILVVMMH